MEAKKKDLLRTNYPPNRSLNQQKLKELQSQPNAKLCSSTFDANHLDRFLHTEYGQIPQPAAIVATPFDTVGSSLKGVAPPNMIPFQQSILPINSNVRPDYCFLTVPRDNRKDAICGMNEKPISLVYRDMIHYQEQESKGKQVYQKEMEKLEQMQKEIAGKKLLLDQEDRKLKRPIERRKEMEEVKKNMIQYHEAKAKHALINRQDKLVKTGWKNGIVGVDSVFDKNTHFYKEKQEIMMNSEMEKDCINLQNKEAVAKYKITNPLIELHNCAGYKPPEAAEKIKIVPEWTNKAVSQERFTNTHKRLFEPLENKFNKAHAEKLRLEETKGRQFNILNGASNKIKL